MGLRWWSNINEEGTEEWIFESLDESMYDYVNDAYRTKEFIRFAYFLGDNLRDTYPLVHFHYSFSAIFRSF